MPFFEALSCFHLTQLQLIRRGTLVFLTQARGEALRDLASLTFLALPVSSLRLLAFPIEILPTIMVGKGFTKYYIWVTSGAREERSGFRYA